MVNEQITITKLDAASRQIETAIELFFNEKDIVSIHTLAGAAHTILYDISDAKGNSVSSKKRMEETLKEQSELLKIFRQAWNKPQNFLKHANKDHNETIPFNYMFTTVVLFDALAMYKTLTGKLTAWDHIFWSWFLKKNEEEYKKNEPPLIPLLENFNYDPDNLQVWREPSVPR